MKKYLKLFVVLFLCTFLVGCGCSKKEDKKDEKAEVRLYTEGNKLVYNNNDVYKLVFYYDGDKITGYEHYYTYADSKAAEDALKKAKEELKNNKTIKEIKQVDKYVVYVMNESEYKDKTVSSVKESYSYLVPVYEK